MFKKQQQQPFEGSTRIVVDNTTTTGSGTAAAATATAATTTTTTTSSPTSTSRTAALIRSALDTSSRRRRRRQERPNHGVRWSSSNHSNNNNNNSSNNEHHNSDDVHVEIHHIERKRASLLEQLFYSARDIVQMKSEKMQEEEQFKLQQRQEEKELRRIQKRAKKEQRKTKVKARKAARSTIGTAVTSTATTDSIDNTGRDTIDNSTAAEQATNNTTTTTTTNLPQIQEEEEEKQEIGGSMIGTYLGDSKITPALRDQNNSEPMPVGNYYDNDETTTSERDTGYQSEEPTNTEIKIANVEIEVVPTVHPSMSAPASVEGAPSQMQLSSASESRAEETSATNEKDRSPDPCHSGDARQASVPPTKSFSPAAPIQSSTRAPEPPLSPRNPPTTTPTATFSGRDGSEHEDATFEPKRKSTSKRWFSRTASSLKGIRSTKKGKSQSQRKSKTNTKQQNQLDNLVAAERKNGIDDDNRKKDVTKKNPVPPRHTPAFFSNLFSVFSFSSSAAGPAAK